MGWIISPNVLDTANNSLFLTDPGNGTITVTESANNSYTDNQQWTPIYNTNTGLVCLVNEATGNMLQCSGGVATTENYNDGTVNAASCGMSIAQNGPSGYYVIACQNADLYLNVQGGSDYTNGNTVIFFEWQPTAANEQWKFTLL